MPDGLDAVAAGSVVCLPGELADGLLAVSRAHDVPVELTLLAAFAVFVLRHGGGPDQTAVTSADGPARRPGIQLKLTDDLSFTDALSRLREHAPLFAADPPTSLRIELRPGAGMTEGFGVEPILTVSRSPHGLHAGIDCGPDEAGRWTARWYILLAAVVAEPTTAVRRLAVLPPEERALLLGEWSHTSSRTPGVESVNELVESWAERTPEATALVQGGRELTYAELNAAANRLAHRLRERRIGPEAAVALYGGSTVAMVVGMLAVLKAGGYYVPLDTAAPRARTTSLLAECAPRLVLTEAPDTDWLSEPPGRGWELHRLSDSDFADGRADNPAIAVHGENLAYVMHTSGSTGRPKGVAMPHRALVRILDWYVAATEIEPGARVLQFSALTFDAAFCEVFGAWHAGACLVLLPDPAVRRDPEALLDLLESERIDHMEAPYSGLLNIAHWAARPDGRRAVRLRTVVTGGEQLVMAPDLVHWLQQMPGCVLRNGYGPSETSVATTTWLRGNPADWPHLPPIGRPITDASVYLLDEALQPTPIGAAGEIYIGGPIVARGYAGRPGLTAERFVADPFSSVPGSRMYRTGDLACHRPDGELKFLGRADRQMKIRGHRVEPGEIEAWLLEHPRVGEAAVTLHRGEAGPNLVAYVVARDAASPPIAGELREHAVRMLPEHMLPGRFVLCAALPLAATGKLDRAALKLLSDALPDQEPPPGRPAEPGRMTGRLSPTAAAVLGIWRDVLAVPQIEVDDDFFELGGHSLLATRVISRIRTALGKRILIGDLFECPTVESLAARIDETDKTAAGESR